MRLGPDFLPMPASRRPQKRTEWPSPGRQRGGPARSQCLPASPCMCSGVRPPALRIPGACRPGCGARGSARRCREAVVVFPFRPLPQAEKKFSGEVLTADVFSCTEERVEYGGRARAGEASPRTEIGSAVSSAWPSTALQHQCAVATKGPTAGEGAGGVVQPGFDSLASLLHPVAGLKSGGTDHLKTMLNGELKPFGRFVSA